VITWLDDLKTGDVVVVGGGYSYNTRLEKIIRTTKYFYLNKKVA